jgi:hypothetical protein
LSGSPPGLESETSRGREGREGSEEGKRGGHREKDEVDSFGFSSSVVFSCSFAAPPEVMVTRGGRGGGGEERTVFSSAEVFLRRSSGTGGSSAGELEVDGDDDDDDDDVGDEAPLLLFFCFSPSIFAPCPPPKGHERLANDDRGPQVIILNVGRDRRASTAASTGCEDDTGNDGDIESNAFSSIIIDGGKSSPWRASARFFGRARRGMHAM